MVLIKQLEIKEFRGIKECKSPLKLSKFTVIVGRNNSGKTTILEALSLFPNPKTPLPIYGNSPLNVLRNVLHSKNTLFYGYTGVTTIKYTLDEIKLYEITIKEGNHIHILIDGVQFAKGTLEQLAEKLKVDYKNLENLVFLIPNDTEFIGKMLSDLKVNEVAKNKIMKSKAHVTIVDELVNQCVDDHYSEVIIASEDLHLRKELPDGNIFYIKPEDLGDGIKKVLVTTLWLEALQPAIVLWDDFEASIHPSLIKALLQWLTTKKWQTIIVTHSIDVLYHLVDISPPDCNILLVKKNQGDILYHISHTIDELADLLEGNQDPRMLVDAIGL